ncbi:MAG: U32 family peptidase [Bacteroidales bacterium]|nr:U32 family peptidase [Bacteroidales bacterium]MBR0324273.1 U32 family peptidase [Bacteroidales bacterium]
MAPVGSYEALSAAIQAGAGSVYFGIGRLNMRSKSAKNFTLDDLNKIATICNENNVKSYVTINTVVFDSELDDMRELVDAVKANGISAIIASDQSVIQYARQIGVEVHMSTQCNITNIEAIRYYSQFADVMVTAREVSVEQVKAITRKIEEQNIRGPKGELIRIEVFCHGALCMAVSGKCYLSLDNFNTSANRGACVQPCRRGYTVQDRDKEITLNIDNEYIMSPKDLCTLPFLDKVLDAGVKILKIEGRGRSPEYTKVTVGVYSEAVKAIQNGEFTEEKVAAWTERLRSVYNRDFWDGYYLGRKTGEWTKRYGSQATKTKIFVGTVTNFFGKINVAEIRMETQDLKVGDDIMIIGPTTGVYEDTVSEIRVDLKAVESTEKGELCSIPAKDVVRRGDKVYKVIDAVL